MVADADPIDAHFGTFPEAQAAALRAVWATARRALPGAVPVLAWGMPTLRIGVDDRGRGGDLVLSLEGFRRHNSLFPHSGSITGGTIEGLDAFTVTKGTIHFAVDRRFPAELLRRIIRARVAEINASYPRKSGAMRAYHANGVLKSLPGGS